MDHLICERNPYTTVAKPLCWGLRCPPPYWWQTFLSLSMSCHMASLTFSRLSPLEFVEVVSQAYHQDSQVGVLYNPNLKNATPLWIDSSFSKANDAHFCSWCCFLFVLSKLTLTSKLPTVDTVNCQINLNCFVHSIIHSPFFCFFDSQHFVAKFCSRLAFFLWRLVQRVLFPKWYYY